SRTLLKRMYTVERVVNVDATAKSTRPIRGWLLFDVTLGCLITASALFLYFVGNGLRPEKFDQPVTRDLIGTWTILADLNSRNAADASIVLGADSTYSTHNLPAKDTGFEIEKGVVSVSGIWKLKQGNLSGSSSIEFFAGK